MLGSAGCARTKSEEPEGGVSISGSRWLFALSNLPSWWLYGRAAADQVDHCGTEEPEQRGSTDPQCR